LVVFLEKKLKVRVMATTSIDLGEHFKGFLKQLKESGRYRNASEAVRAGLRLLEQEEAENRTKIEWLRQELIAGEQSGETDCTLDQILDEVKAEFNAK
jgi:antitoxin ParD1/3/4